MTFHLVQVYSKKPWAAVIPASLMACEDSLSVEDAQKAVKRGKCKRGHTIDVVMVAKP
jgi:hypothetical protein